MTSLPIAESHFASIFLGAFESHSKLTGVIVVLLLWQLRNAKHQCDGTEIVDNSEINANWFCSDTPNRYHIKLRMRRYYAISRCLLVTINHKLNDNLIRTAQWPIIYYRLIKSLKSDVRVKHSGAGSPYEWGQEIIHLCVVSHKWTRL